MTEKECEYEELLAALEDVFFVTEKGDILECKHLISNKHPKYAVFSFGDNYGNEILLKKGALVEEPFSVLDIVREISPYFFQDGLKSLFDHYEQNEAMNALNGIYKNVLMLSTAARNALHDIFYRYNELLQELV